MKKDDIIHLTCAHDGGNGFMKDQIFEDRYLFPSIMAEVLPGQELDKTDVHDVENVKKTLADFLTQMDITVDSPSLQNNGRYLVGQQATLSGMTPINFNVNSVDGKSTSDISLICLFSLVAYYALRQFYNNKEYIPDTLNVVVDKLATALPISEIKLPGVQQKYAQRFTQALHHVTINNFSVSVNVTIEFPDVVVDPEGVAAVTGLVFDPEQLNYRQGAIFTSLFEDYGLEAFNGKKILDLGNVLTIDIGDGTIDFVVTNRGARVSNQNKSILTGVGNITENAITALRQDYPVIPPMDRQTFVEIAQRHTPTKESQVYKKYWHQQTIILERQIVEEVKDFHRALHGQIGMIILCGGGAMLLRKSFSETFKQSIARLFPLSEPYILWVPEKYAQYLNLDGLVVRCQTMK